MSQYTTGEMAKMCGVTVRTVQYYDTRGILIPSAVSEGGRRLYSESDLHKMKIICFLRELDLPINSIAQILSKEHPEKVIELMLQQQKSIIKNEIRENQEKLTKLEQLQRGLKALDSFSVEAIGDIATFMSNKKKLYKMRWKMLSVGFVMDVLEITAVLLWILKGIWWPFVFVALPAVIALGIGISVYYFAGVSYICPECHQVFRTGFKEMFWAWHTPSARKLTCTACGHKGFCVETYHNAQGQI